MKLSQKCQYAIRAVFQLAKEHGGGPVKIADVAEAQAIPPRFLELILGELKQGGFTESRRGKRGGYLLAREPRDITVGDIIRFVEGPLGPVECEPGENHEGCPLHPTCVFMPLWTEARDTVEAVYDGKTFQDLVEEERRLRDQYVPSYTI